jgi:hypothetical protein
VAVSKKVVFWADGRKLPIKPEEPLRFMPEVLVDLFFISYPLVGSVCIKSFCHSPSVCSSEGISIRNLAENLSSILSTARSRAMGGSCSRQIGIKPRFCYYCGMTSLCSWLSVFSCYIVSFKLISFFRNIFKFL